MFIIQKLRYYIGTITQAELIANSLFKNGIPIFLWNRYQILTIAGYGQTLWHITG